MLKSLGGFMIIMVEVLNSDTKLGNHNRNNVEISRWVYDNNGRGT